MKPFKAGLEVAAQAIHTAQVKLSKQEKYAITTFDAAEAAVTGYLHWLEMQGFVLVTRSEWENHAKFH
jgi:hypothetical protein